MQFIFSKNFNQKRFNQKRPLNEKLKQQFLLNLYENVSDLFFDFAVHKFCRALENLILQLAYHNFISIIAHKYVDICLNSIFSNTI